MLKGVEESLTRARTIADTLHLLPPSPLLLKLWVIEGRQMAQEEMAEEARERWLAVIDEPEALGLPVLRAEALIRLALLEFARKRPEDAGPFVQRLGEGDLAAALPPSWVPLIADLERIAPATAHGGARLPPAARSSGHHDPERRERGRR
jgi:hypothetical protein